MRSESATFFRLSIEQHGAEKTFPNLENTQITFAKGSFIREAAKQLQATLVNWFGRLLDNRVPTICCVHSAKSGATLRSDYPALANFALVCLNVVDSSHLIRGLPVDWIASTTKELTKQFLACYGVLPVCRGAQYARFDAYPLCRCISHRPNIWACQSATCRRIS